MIFEPEPTINPINYHTSWSSGKLPLLTLLVDNEESNSISRFMKSEITFLSGRWGIGFSRFNSLMKLENYTIICTILQTFILKFKEESH